MRLLLLVNEVEHRIAAGEAHIKEELEAFYSGLHAIYAQERDALESEYLALKHIAERIFNVSDSGEVPPSSAVAAGEPVSGSQVSGGEASAPAINSASEAIVSPAEEHLGAPVGKLLDEENGHPPVGQVEDHSAELHKFADDGNPHHDEGEHEDA